MIPSRRTLCFWVSSSMIFAPIRSIVVITPAKPKPTRALQMIPVTSELAKYNGMKATASVANAARQTGINEYPFYQSCPDGNTGDRNE